MSSEIKLTGREITIYHRLFQGDLSHCHQRHRFRQSLILHSRLRQGQDLSGTLLPAAGPRASNQRLQQQGRKMGTEACYCSVLHPATFPTETAKAGRQDASLIIYRLF